MTQQKVRKTRLSNPFLKRLVGLMLTSAAFDLLAVTHFVDVNSTNPTPPYTSWAIAATNIQDSVNLASIGDEILVTNGIYAPIGVDKPLRLRSINGPLFTLIDGAHANRCVYLTNGASMSGFTLTHGAADVGGGVFSESTNALVSNCVLSDNLAYNFSTRGHNGDAGAGGGAFGCTLKNCLLTGNSAVGQDGCNGGWGGGAYASSLKNCTLTGNSVIGQCQNSFGGGAYGCDLNNCIVYFNTNNPPINPPNGGENYDSSTLSHCCTAPDPGGIGNITNAPSFVDLASGNLRLQFNSPCINAGLNALAPAGPDLDGNPRIVGGTVDIGAYEFQFPTSVISYAWLQQYGLPTDGSADFTDPDGDGMNNWQEWRCGTNPTNAASALRLLSPTSDGTNVLVTWESVAGVNYSVERATSMPGTFTPIARGIVGQPGTTIYSDTNAVAAEPLFYRVCVQDF